MKKLFTFAVCVVMLFCAIFAGACNADTPRASLEIKNDGVSVLWKYGDEDVWHELVKLKDLKGSDGIDGKDGANGKDGIDGKDGVDGENGKDGVDGKDGKDGKDGRDGANGKDGVNGENGVDGANGKDGNDGKTVEIQTNETHIQWRHAGEEWQNLIAIADIKGPAGKKGKDGANGKDGKDGKDGIDGTNGKDGENGKDGKTPEFRVEEGVFQWRYSGDEIWFNLYDLSLLKGKDGADGKDGKDGVDGMNGKDGKDGVDGINGKDGRNGIDGANGKDGKDGVCAGYFYAQGNALTTLSFTEKTNNGSLIAYNSADCSIKLKGGHAYILCFSGSLSLIAKKTDCVFGAALVDGYDNNQCMNSTLIRVNSTTGNMTYQGPMIYNRIYVATEDITLKFMLTNYMLIETTVSTFNYNLTVIALN